MSASVDDAPRARPAIDRTVWIRIAVILGAVVLGLGLNHLVQAHLTTLQALAEVDPISARTRLAYEVRVGGLGLFAVTALLGVSLLATARRGARELRFPPTGLWGWGASRVVTGPPARRLAVVGAVLGAMLVVCSLAGATVSWRMGTVLLACRAGVPAEHAAP